MKWKATILAVGLLLLWTAPSFAEVQNVRVGGDITVRVFHRENLDLAGEDDHAEPTDSIGDGSSWDEHYNSVLEDNGLGILGCDGSSVPAKCSLFDGQDDFISQWTGVNVAADLTENVSAFIRLLSERDWNVDSNANVQTDDHSDEHRIGASVGDFEAAQAYITLKEFFYTPLTIRIGRQPISWGRGLILGSSLIPDTQGRPGDLNSALSPDEYTGFTSFDAFRVTLDLQGTAAIDLPVTVDYVYIKLDENDIGQPDDINIQGVNVGTRFDQMNGEVEAYYLNKRDKNTEAFPTVVEAVSPPSSINGDGSVNTLGVRGSFQPMDGTYVFGELAYQFGKRATDPTLVLSAGDSQQAWAANLGAEYTLSDMTWSPMVGAEWLFLSGKDVDGGVAGWDPLARGYFPNALRDFQNVGFYLPDQRCLQAGTFGPCTSTWTNQHTLSLYGRMSPLQDLTVAPRISWFILDEDARPIGTDGVDNQHQKYAGFEWDTQVTYDYTEDVQLGFLYALFVPGNTYRSPWNDTAQELVTSISVQF